LVATGTGLTVGVTTMSQGGDAGRVQKLTDPRGLIAKTDSDLLGRTLRTVENYVNFAPSALNTDRDRTTESTYDGNGNLLTLTARLPAGGPTVPTGQGAPAPPPFGRPPGRVSRGRGAVGRGPPPPPCPRSAGRAARAAPAAGRRRSGRSCPAPWRRAARAGYRSGRRSTPCAAARVCRPARGRPPPAAPPPSSGRRGRTRSRCAGAARPPATGDGPGRRSRCGCRCHRRT